MPAARWCLAATRPELEDEASGDLVKYQIVGEDEADLKLWPDQHQFADVPALIGKEEGDTAEVQAPGRRQAL